MLHYFKTENYIKYYKKNTKNSDKEKHLFISSVPNTVEKSIAYARRFHERREKVNLVFVYLWTKAKPPAYEQIAEHVDKFFDEIIFLTLPRGNQNANLLNVARIHGLYRVLLDDKVASVTVFSFDRHYSLLLDIAKSKNIKLVLGEEGTASYKYLISNDAYVGNKRSFLGHLYYIYKNFWSKTEIIALIVAPFIFVFNLFKNLIVSLYKTYKYIFFIENFHIPMIEKIQRYRPFLKPHTEFDRIYLDYPDVLLNYFKADEVIMNDNHSICEEYGRAIEESCKNYNYNRDTVIYASQIVWGVKAIKLLPIIQEILIGYFGEDQKIIFKPHPKEDIKELQKVMMMMQFNIFELVQDYSYPIEDLIAHVKPKAVVSIASSTLVYAKLRSPDTQYISVIEDLEKKISEEKLHNERTVKFFTDFTKLMKLFPHIKIGYN